MAELVNLAVLLSLQQPVGTARAVRDAKCAYSPSGMAARNSWRDSRVMSGSRCPIRMQGAHLPVQCAGVTYTEKCLEDTVEGPVGRWAGPRGSHHGCEQGLLPSCQHIGSLGQCCLGLSCLPRFITLCRTAGLNGQPHSRGLSPILGSQFHSALKSPPSGLPQEHVRPVLHPSSPALPCAPLELRLRSSLEDCGALP